MNITEYYIGLLEQFRSVRVAEQEFRRHMEDDPELQKQYLEWCEANEYEPRDGLRDFGEQYVEEREERWNSLSDFDDMQ